MRVNAPSSAFHGEHGWVAGAYLDLIIDGQPVQEVILPDPPFGKLHIWMTEDHLE